LIYDTGKKGLETVFLDYQVEVWRHVWRKPSHQVFSLDAWEAVNRALAPRTVSRASVINFLNGMADEGLLERGEASGKGGMKGTYTAIPNVSDSEAALKYTLRQRLLGSLREELVG